MPDILKKHFFWVALVSVVYIVITFYKPNFPLSLDQLVAAVIFILGLFGLKVEQALHRTGFLR